MSKPVETLTGAIVLVAAIGFVVYGGKLSGLGQGGVYPLKASFRSLEGVSPGTDVRLAGVKIGTVGAITLDPQTFFGDADLLVLEGVKLPADSEARISSEGLLGGSFVEILPGGSPDNYAPGDTISYTQGAVSVVDLLLRFVGSGSGSGADSGSGGDGAQ